MKKMIYTLLIGAILPLFSIGQSILTPPKTIIEDNTTSFISFSKNNHSNHKILVKGNFLNAAEVLSNYIKHKSISGYEKHAGDWFRDICLENGLIINQFGEKDGNYNFSASLFPLSDSLPNIIYLNHIDVVPAGEIEEWVHPPYSGYITETEIWGRGAFDNKGAAIMQLFSILKFKSETELKDLPYNVTLLAVSGEETLSDGGLKYVLKNYLKKLNPKLVIGEGATELSDIIDSNDTIPVFGISVAHKRPLWLELDLSISTSEHGSVTPIEYANKELTIALSKLVQKKSKVIFTQTNKEILRSLGEEESGIKKFILKHPVIFKPLVVSELRKQPELLALFTNTVTLTSINCKNETFNRIPSSVNARLDCRLLPQYSNEKAIKNIKRILKNDNIELSINRQMDVMCHSKSYGEFYNNLKNAVENSYPGAKVFPIMLPNYNDVGYFRCLGIQCYSIIPIQLTKDHLKCIHGENERIPIKALSEGINTYTTFIENCMITKPEIEEDILF